MSLRKVLRITNSCGQLINDFGLQRFSTVADGELSYVHGIGEKPLLFCTIAEILRKQTEKNPDQQLFIFPKQSKLITYQQFYQDVNNFASGLLALGLNKGDRVGMWGPNVYEWVVTQFATAVSGLIMVNINPAYRTSEMEYCLRKVGVSCLIASNTFKTQNYHQMIAEICPSLQASPSGKLTSEKLPSLKHIIFLDDNRERGCLTFNDVYALANKESRNQVQSVGKKLQPDEPVNIQFTSGTTGAPKGATLSHFNIVNNAEMIGRRLGYVDEPPIICCPPPLYHCFGCVGGSLLPVVHGGTTIFPSPGFEPLACLEVVHNYKCNALYGTPTMFIDMLNHNKFADYSYTSLRTGIIGGAPCPFEVGKRIIEKLHMKDVTIVYGTTENSPGTFQTLIEDEPLQRIQTVGQVMDHLEAKIIDKRGCIVPLNRHGELCIRGHAVMLGYWNDVDKTNEAFGPDRWYKTGDLAIMDDNKYVKVVGRQKDVIIRGGENVYPTEVEGFLCTHPKIADVHVIGVPDNRMGEEVCAWIRLHEGVKCTETEIREFCKGKIAHFKIPRYICFKQLTDFPFTVTGKVQKYKMKELAKEELDLGGVKSHINEEITK